MVSCQPPRPIGPEGQRPLDQVIGQVSKEWILLPGVVSVAQGEYEGRPCILVLCTCSPSQLRSKIPDNVEGYRVIIQKTDSIKALR